MSEEGSQSSSVINASEEEVRSALATATDELRRHAGESLATARTALETHIGDRLTELEAAASARVTEALADFERAAAEASAKFALSVEAVTANVSAAEAQRAERDATAVATLEAKVTTTLTQLDTQAEALRAKVDAAETSLAANKSASDEQLATLRTELETARKEDAAAHAAGLAELQKKVSDAREELATAVGTVNGQLDGHRKTVATLVETIGKEGRSAVEAWQTATAAEEDSRRKTIEADLAKWRDDHEKLRTDQEGVATVWLTDATAKREEFDKAQLASAGNYVKELERYKSSAAEVLGEITATGMAEHYEQEAGAAFAHAERWRNITLWAGGIGAALIGIIAIATFVMQRDPTWPVLVARITTGLAAIVVAGWTASVAAKFQSTATRCKQLALDLKAIGPYLESLSPEKRNEVKEKMVERWFGRQDDRPSVAEPKLVSMLAEVIAKLPATKPHE